jgi:hypothetical protein
MAAKTLHPELKITLPKGKGGSLLACFRVGRNHTGNVRVIVRNGGKPNLIGGVILSLKHTTIGPLPGIIQATAYTLATRDFDGGALKRRPNLEIFPYRILEGSNRIMGLAIWVHTIRYSNERIITRHFISSLANHAENQ